MEKKLKKNALMPVAALCLAWPLAHAQNVETGDTLQFRAGAAFEHDSNVLRAPNAVSDQAGIYSVGARWDKTYSLQRIVVDAEAAATRYKDNSSLDYNTVNYNAAWHFAVTPAFRGIVSAERRQQRDLTDATNGLFVARLRTLRRERAEGTYTTGVGWLGTVGADRVSSRVDTPRALDASPSINSVWLGAGRQTPAGSSLVLQYRHGSGDYGFVTGPGNDFKENEIALVARYPVSVRTSLEGRIGRLERKHDGAPQRDFSGAIASLRANWEITAKTSIAGEVARDLGSYEFGSGGSVRANRFFVEPTWRATEKITVRLRWAHENRDWFTFAGAPDAGRSDTVNYTSAAVDWEPIRRLHVLGGLRNERRSSNLPGFDFRANIVTVGARYVF